MQADQSLPRDHRAKDQSPIDSTTTRARRRRVIKGAAAVVGGAAAASYVPPSLTRLGVAAALAMSGSPSPTPTTPPPATSGCTPGFWGNSPWGQGLWNTANDPEWVKAGAVAAPNPFTTTTIFGSFFTPVYGEATVNNSSMQNLVNTGGTSDPVRQAARDLVAAYLNAAFFGSGYPLSTSTLISDWDNAVTAFNNSGHTDKTAFSTLHNQLNALNNATCNITKP